MSHLDPILAARARAATKYAQTYGLRLARSSTIADIPLL